MAASISASPPAVHSRSRAGGDEDANAEQPKAGLLRAHQLAEVGLLEDAENSDQRRRCHGLVAVQPGAKCRIDGVGDNAGDKHGDDEITEHGVSFACGWIGRSGQPPNRCWTSAVSASLKA